MAQTQSVINDFRSGMVDEQFGYRSDLSIYNTSAHLLENVVVTHAGGLKQRPGLTFISLLQGTKKLIPFTLSVREQYLIALKEKELHIFKKNTNGVWQDISAVGFYIPHTEEELDEVRFTQNNQILVLVHRNHPPYIVSKTEEDAFRVAQITLDTDTDRVDVSTDSSGNETETEFQYDYGGLFTQNNYPSVCTFCSNRLWLGSSKENPGRLWASQPFKYNNFQDFAYYKVVDDAVTAEQYLKAVEAYTNKVVDNGDGTETRTSKTVSPDGYVVITTGTYSQETGALIGEETTETFNYSTPAVTWEEYVREDSAMILDLASDRDEEIRWIAYVTDLIFVGTASSEWAMPFSITPQNASISKMSSYGSRENVPLCYGVRNVFYVQSGGRRLRSIARTNTTSYMDLTIQCSDILSTKVVDMAWQRVQEPRLYVVLEDGDIRVLCYDEDYGLNAWVKWDYNKNCVSVAVIDVAEGQEVYILFDDGIIAMIDEDNLTDMGTTFEPHVITNCLDSFQLMILNKKIYNVNIFAGKTKFRCAKYGLPLRYPPNFGHRLIQMAITNDKDFRDGTQIEIVGEPGEEFRIHAVVTLMEVY